MNEISFPVEFIIEGTPLSLKVRGQNRTRWIAKVRELAKEQLPDCFATTEKVAVTIYYFATDASTVDVDNIVKLILDALQGPVYCDDNQVGRILSQRFDPGTILDFTDPSAVLIQAIAADRPVTFVRIHTNLKPLE